MCLGVFSAVWVVFGCVCVCSGCLGVCSGVFGCVWVCLCVFRLWFHQGLWSEGLTQLINQDAWSQLACSANVEILPNIVASMCTQEPVAAVDAKC